MKSKNDIKIMEILGDMEQILNEASAFLLSKKVSIDKEEMLDLIGELKEALPYELDTAIKIIENQENILETAESEAKFIREDAKKDVDFQRKECNEEIASKHKQADMEIENMMREATIRAEELVSQNKITREAKDRAEVMIREAKEYSRSIREGSRLYSIDQLTAVENVLSGLLEEVKNNKTQL